MALEDPRDGGEKPIVGILLVLAVIELILRLDDVVFDRTVIESDNILISGQAARGTRGGIGFRMADEADEREGRVAELASEDSRVQA